MHYHSSLEGIKRSIVLLTKGDSFLSEQNKQTFYGAAALLAATTVIVKIVGALYKIPLGIVLSDAAYGDFNGAYNIYSFFLTVSTAGLPVALSKTVSESNALGRQAQKQQVFRVAAVVFLAMGLFSFLCMSFLGQWVATNVINNAKAVYCVWALSPAVLCTCCCAAFRGYAQGHMDMAPTGISQILEAVSKLFIGLGLALLIGTMAFETADLKERLMAAGAVAGVSVGSVLSIAFLIWYYIRKKDRRVAGTDLPDKKATIFSKLLRLAIPITLSSCTMSIVTLIDTNLVMGQLQSVFDVMGSNLSTISGSFLGITEKAGTIFTEQTLLASEVGSAVEPALDSARSLYGVYSKAMSIYNLPFSLMVPLTASIIPAISACMARRDHLGAKSIAESVMKVSAIVAFPCGVGLVALGEPIMNLLYFGNVDATIGGPLLSILGLASIFVCLQLICTSILQANGIVTLPILTVAVGGLVKILVNYALVGNPMIMIFGAPVGTLCCFVVVAGLNLIIIKKMVPQPPRYLTSFAKPMIAAVLMGMGAWASYGFMNRVLGDAFLMQAIATGLAICVGVVVYVVLIVLLRVLTKEDVALMPKGDKIAKLLRIR